MKNFSELSSIISGMHFSNYSEVENYFEGEEIAVKFFADCELNGDVEMRELKLIKTYDEDTNMTITTTIYECYVDSGGTDYYYFSYNKGF